MKGELKAGGLALVMGMTENAQDNGKCVELVRILHPGQFFDSPDGVSRCVDPKAAGKTWLVVGRVSPMRNGKLCDTITGWALYYPRNLLPIDGDDHQEQEQLTKDKPAELTA